MTHDWLLVETLGTEPAVVARGRQTKNLVPISAFLRRNPHLMAIQTAIGETVRAGQGLSSITPKNDRVIRTEVVQMSDGRFTASTPGSARRIWSRRSGPIPGPLKWDLTSGVATDTPESLFNSGKNPATEATHGRAFAEDLPTRDLNPDRDQGAVDGDQARAGHDVLHHLGCHRLPGRADRGRFRRPRASGEPGRRNRAADLSSDELAQLCARDPRCRADYWRSESSTAWHNPACIGRWWISQLDAVQMARRAGAVLRLAGQQRRVSRLCIPPIAPHGPDDSEFANGADHRCASDARPTMAVGRRCT